jgi:subtilisin family serine protease
MGRGKGRHVRPFFLCFFYYPLFLFLHKHAFETHGRFGAARMIYGGRLPADSVARRRVAGSMRRPQVNQEKADMRFDRIAAALFASGFIAGAAQAGEFRAAHAPAIPQQYIVTLDHDPGQDLKSLQPELSAALTARRIVVTTVWNSALNGFVMAGVSAKTAMDIAKVPGVLMVEPDYITQADTVQTGAPIGLDLVDQHSLTTNGTYIYNYTAPLVHAYVIDSGIRTTHGDFGGRATADANFANDNAANDPFNHGTGVASVIGGATYGVAKQAHLHSVRVFDSAGQGTTSQVISALNWVNTNGVHPGVVNMSMQFGATTALDSALGTVIGSGFFAAVSAGNRPTTTIEGFDDACTISPARVPDAFTVADAAIYSYRGTCVDMFAPGTGIPVASSASDSATKGGTGTSYSAPHAAGAAALAWQQFPSLNPRQVSWELIARSSKNLLTESASWHLYGSPNRFLYTQSIGYSVAPSMPSQLTRDACFPPHYFADWTAGTVNGTNTATYYELQRSTSATFTSVTSTYADASISTGYAQFTSASPLFFRVRSCNSIGCSAFKSSVNAGCN